MINQFNKMTIKKKKKKMDQNLMNPQMNKIIKIMKKLTYRWKPKRKYQIMKNN